jgi:hypothetical protein
MFFVHIATGKISQLAGGKRITHPEPDEIPTEEAFKKEKKDIEKVAKILKVRGKLYSNLF